MSGYSCHDLGGGGVVIGIAQDLRSTLPFEEMERWCAENCDGAGAGRVYWYFQNDQDALKFIMRWLSA